MDNITADKIKNRRSFLPGLLFGLVLFLIWLLIFFFVPPDSWIILFAFLALTFLVIFVFGSLLMANTRRGLFASLVLVIFMVLGYYEAGNWLNLALIVGVFLAAEYYVSKN